MKKIFTLVSRIEVGALGTLLLGLIFLAVHVIYFAFKVYGLLPMFYGIIFLVIIANMVLSWRARHR
ncbi:hypothetical protein [Salinimicrobium sp. WS361]|uniref:hypothetical protein n=1 Tax=Salinimicrobium sp. WS361 TaxID=3425123 RepID=UPI003D6E6AA9